MQLDQMVAQLTPEGYQALVRAVELGKWETGERLSSEQLVSAIQVVLLYQATHNETDDEQRVFSQQETGLDIKFASKGKADKTQPQPITLVRK